jgi:TRAP transporter TAXI family solute receptor
VRFVQRLPAARLPPQLVNRNWIGRAPGRKLNMSENRFRRLSWLGLWLFPLVVCALCGCGGGDGGAGGGDAGGRRFVTLGTAPVGGAFRPVGEAISSVLNEHKGEAAWRVQPKGTKGSQQNILGLEDGELQLAMSNSAISYHAVQGRGGFEKPYEIRAVVTLAPNIGLFITKQDSGIRTLADLKNKNVTVGPAGAGFEMFLGPLLTAHGVTYTDQQQDFRPNNDTYSNAVGALGDGTVDACFMGGAIPTQAVTQACRTYPVYFIPYDESVRQQLIEQYPFYRDVTVPAKTKSGDETYPGMTEDFPAMDVGSMHLITSADADQEFIYQITRIIWEHRAEIAAQHKAGNAINEQNAARYTGTPFHDGAIRFYREIGIWPEDAAGEQAEQAADEAATTTPGDDGTGAGDAARAAGDNGSQGEAGN